MNGLPLVSHGKVAIGEYGCNETLQLSGGTYQSNAKRYEANG